MDYIAYLITIFIVIAIASMGTFLFTGLGNLITKKYQLVILLIAAAPVFEMTVSPLRAISFATSSVGGFILFLLFTNYLLKKYSGQFKAHQITLCLIIGSCLLIIPFEMSDWPKGLLSLPDLLAHTLGILGGYFFYNRKQVFHKINLSVSVLIILFSFFYGYDLWIHNLQFGSFANNVHERSPDLSSLVYKTGDPLKKGKITVIDFWFIGCGSCIREFPDFQKLYNTYKSNPDIQFMSVDMLNPKDQSGDGFDILSKLDYTFPMAESNSREMIKGLKIAAYPTIVVLDQHGDVVYRGEFKDVPEKIKAML